MLRIVLGILPNAKIKREIGEFRFYTGVIKKIRNPEKAGERNGIPVDDTNQSLPVIRLIITQNVL